jgi:hypothetical protein
MKKLSLIQISGVTGCGKTKFLQRLGLGGVAAPALESPLYDNTAETILRASDMLEEMAGHPAQRDWLNDLLIWQHGFVELIARDIELGWVLGPKAIAAAWRASQRILEPVGSQVILVADGMVQKPGDPALRQRAEEERDRVLRATSMLRSLGAEVYRFHTYDDAAPGALLRSFFTEGRVSGFGHVVTGSGVIRLGEQP